VEPLVQNRHIGAFDHLSKMSFVPDITRLTETELENELLYGLGEGSSGYVKTQNLSFSVCDSLTNIGPIADIAMGHAATRLVHN